MLPFKIDKGHEHPGGDLIVLYLGYIKHTRIIHKLSLCHSPPIWCIDVLVFGCPLSSFALCLDLSFNYFCCLYSVSFIWCSGSAIIYILSSFYTLLLLCDSVLMYVIVLFDSLYLFLFLFVMFLMFLFFFYYIFISVLFHSCYVLFLMCSYLL